MLSPTDLMLDGRVDCLRFHRTAISSSLKWDDKSICIKKRPSKTVFPVSVQNVWAVEREDAAPPQSCFRTRSHIEVLQNVFSH